MPSPLPGMDPYLEAPTVWALFHHGMIMSLGELLQPNTGDRYRLRTGTRTYVNQQVLFTSIVREEQKEEFLEIRQKSSDKLVSLIEIVSPANRTTVAGRHYYKAKRDEAHRAGANLIEMEFVLQGQTCLEIATEGLPEYDYAVSVCRSRQQDRYEIYTTTIQKRLPRIRLPLAGDDRDMIVDLQAVLNRCYDKFFNGRIDYTKEPPVLLTDENHRWLVQTLKQLKLR